jgi:hypothetical protein
MVRRSILKLISTSAKQTKLQWLQDKSSEINGVNLKNVKLAGISGKK